MIGWFVRKQKRAPAKSEFKRITERYSKSLVLWPLVATLLGLFGSLHWILELACHFLPFYFILAAVGTLLLLLVRSWLWAVVGLACCCLHLTFWLSFYIPPSNQVADDVEPNLRILFANVLAPNEHPEAFLALVRETRPDVVLVQEVDTGWQKALAELKVDYPNYTVVPRSDSFGIAQFLKCDADAPRVLSIAGSTVRALYTRIRVNGQEVRLLNAHTLPPGSKEYAAIRNRQLAEIAEIVLEEETPIIVAGDLNATPWSPHYRSLLSKTGLVNTRRGKGILGTWPAFASFLRIPIDHVLVSAEIGVVGFRRGPDICSDHFPLIVELHIPHR